MPGQIRNSTSPFSFKNQLNLAIRYPPAFDCSGSRQGQIYNVRLRTNCNSLKLHLHFKFVIGSPLCVCGEIEDSCHFLLACNIYSEKIKKVRKSSETDSIKSQISSKTSRGKRAAQKDAIKDITSDSQMNSYFLYRWSRLNSGGNF